MNSSRMATATSTGRRLTLVSAAATLLLATAAHAAAPGITGPAFNLTATDASISQPDGQMVYSWGYGCTTAPAGYAPSAIQPVWIGWPPLLMFASIFRSVPVANSWSGGSKPRGDTMLSTPQQLPEVLPGTPGIQR